MPMEVHVIGNVGFVWDLETVISLRKKHRIVGNLVGGRAGRDDSVKVD